MTKPATIIRAATIIMSSIFIAGMMFMPGCPKESSSQKTKQTVNEVRPEANRVSVAVTNSNNQIVAVNSELAITGEQHARGLMNRSKMAENDGMLFIFPEMATQSFWMKNTLIPLDMIFIDENGIIVDIRRDAQPGDLTAYPSAAPAKYVLEANGGWCAAKNVNVGNKVSIPAGY